VCRFQILKFLTTYASFSFCNIGYISPLLVSSSNCFATIGISIKGIISLNNIVASYLETSCVHFLTKLGTPILPSCAKSFYKVKLDLLSLLIVLIMSQFHLLTYYAFRVCCVTLTYICFHL
jgi:hypothetical protein